LPRAAAAMALVRRVVVSALASSAALAAAAPKRLRVVNACEEEPLWVAHIAAGTAGPDPQDVKIEPLQHHDFTTSDGLAATRYWPKMGCDALGGNCAIGDSGGPGEACVRKDKGYDDYSKCAPPVDTKFEASFGQYGQPCNPQAPGGSEMAGCDYIDMSLVDGFTLPAKLEIEGGECHDSNDGKLVEKIDCSDLTLDRCPGEETLSAAGLTLSLKAINPHTGSVAGCYSPCLRLLDDKWANNGTQFKAEDSGVAPYCCPTPPISPDKCRTGPVTKTQYLDLVHTKCPGAYGYAYDDSMGLLRCTSSSTYVLTYYCPAGQQQLAASVANSTRSRGFLAYP